MDFKAKFNKATVLDFLKNQFLPDDFVETNEVINSFAADRLKEIEYIGESPSLDLKLYLIRHDSENDPRVMLSRETFRFMSSHRAQHALVVYHSASSGNYRLSLATITLALKGAKTKREYSNPRRYSFYLGPDAKTHTPEQFLSERVTDYKDLLGRFSIEVVNKEFYNEIAVKFTELVGGTRKVKSTISNFKPVLRLPDLDMSKPNSHRVAQEFAVRLIGRIVFCWFLKKKKSQSGTPLLPETVLSSAAVQASEKSNDNYYHSVLENLFFQVLNTEAKDRLTAFTKSPYDKIPFLNGGLFAPNDPHDYYRFDEATLSSQSINTLIIPNSWFIGLLKILETYNFTIDENTSVDVELAVDPEMLGRIFENLLAEINPETGETARKATGSYYTPRAIVEYMVDESLKEYLKTKTGISNEKLTDLLSYSEDDTSLSQEEKDKLISAIDEVRIIDPACGSGAFPMGMLQKIAWLLQKIDPKSESWLERQVSRIPDPLLRKETLKHLSSKSVNYIRKMGILRDCIYGVDIQETATDISKLRFFLSLIIDENVNDASANRGIEPLPNLEFKFVCANTLLGLTGGDAPHLGEEEAAIKRLKSLREQYFRSSGREKLELVSKFSAAQDKIFNKLFFWHGQSHQLSTWKPFDNKPSDWFDSDWMFGIKNGFDIVIGNPPYLESRNPLFDKTLKRRYNEEMRRRWRDVKPKISLGSDLLIYFYEVSLSLINDTGVVTLITQNSWLHSDYGKHFQDFAIDNTHILAVVDSNYKYFDSSEGGPNINTVITLFKGKTKQANSEIHFALYDQDFAMVPYHYSDIELLKNHSMATVKKYSESDPIIRKYKWGILFEADALTMEVFKRLGDKGKATPSIRIGQGLNLTKSNEAEAAFVHQHRLEHVAIPFMTNDDGAPFALNSTAKFLLDKREINATQKALLTANGIEPADIGDRKSPQLILPRGIGRYFCADNIIPAYSASYVEISGIPDSETKKNIWLFLNSTIGWLIREISGRKNLGGGMLKAEATDLKNFSICFDFQCKEKIDALYSQLSKREALHPLKEMETSEHKDIDTIVFDFLGFNRAEREEIVEIAKQRISFRMNKSKT